MPARLTPVPARFRCLPLTVLAALAACTGLGASYTTPRLLAVGESYELRRDGCSDPPGGAAYQGDVLPKTDTNSGTNGDNRYFQRHNVARAWATGIGYWYTDADQHAGEPDPAGEQWVDYAPPFEILGPGRYALETAYRGSTNRASYPAVYRVHHALGTNEVLRDQRFGSPAAPVYWFTVGQFEMRAGSFVRVEDTGTGSITFSNMRFGLLAPVPVLKVQLLGGDCILRWATNAVGYRLESSPGFAPAVTWESVGESPETVGAEYKVAFPAGAAARYFRLVMP